MNENIKSQYAHDFVTVMHYDKDKEETTTVWSRGYENVEFDEASEREQKELGMKHCITVYCPQGHYIVLGYDTVEAIVEAWRAKDPYKSFQNPEV